MACIFMVVATSLITIGMKLISNSARESKQQELYVGEAENVAKAGLVDTLGWFRRQNGVVGAYTINNLAPGAVGTYNAGVSYRDQPFNPVNNAVNAQKSDTLDATIGIVNEYSVDAGALSTDANVVYFGRYEVKKMQSVELTMVPTVTPGATPVPDIVRDVSGNRTGSLINGDGIIWSVSSTGYVYKRVDKTFSAGATWAKAYNQAPNKVIATAKVSTEFRKFMVTLPTAGGLNWLGAVYCKSATFITLPTNNQGILNGAVSATSYSVVAMADPPACAVPINRSANNCQGPVTCEAAAGLADTAVFGGLSLSDVQFLADYHGDATNALNIQSDWKLSYYNGSVTFGGALPAPYDRLCIHGTNSQESSASGILIVNGDLVLLGGNLAVSPPIEPSGFEGIVFVTGNLTVQDGSHIDGCVIMGTYLGTTASMGHVTLSGSPGSFGSIYLNPGLVNQALSRVATYRENTTARKTLLAIPGMQ